MPLPAVNPASEDDISVEINDLIDDLEPGKLRSQVIPTDCHLMKNMKNSFNI